MPSTYWLDAEIDFADDGADAVRSSVAEVLELGRTLVLQPVVERGIDHVRI